MQLLKNAVQKGKQIIKFILTIKHKPNFMIVGAQKSGTSSLHYYLSQHPDLRASNPKELHYFDRFIHQNYPLNWYENHFKGLFFRNQIFFESSPNYIYHEETAKQIIKYYPNIKLILILRNPVSRAFSAWNMYRELKEKLPKHMKDDISNGRKNSIYEALYKNKETFPDFIEAINIEKEIIQTKEQKEPAILRRGLYAEQIEAYLKYLDRESILILGFKDLIYDLENTLKKCTLFLDVQPFVIKDLNIEPKNIRKYNRKITNEEESLLEEFYKEPNKRLFKLLGHQPNW